MELFCFQKFGVSGKTRPNAALLGATPRSITRSYQLLQLVSFRQGLQPGEHIVRTCQKLTASVVKFIPRVYLIKSINVRRRRSIIVHDLLEVWIDAVAAQVSLPKAQLKAQMKEVGVLRQNSTEEALRLHPTRSIQNHLVNINDRFVDQLCRLSLVRPQLLLVITPNYRLVHSKLFLKAGQKVKMGHQEAFDNEHIGSNLEFHRFSMPCLVTVVRNSHLDHRYRSGADRHDTGNQGLEIKNEVSPSVTSLPSDSARNTEGKRQKDGYRDNYSDQNKSALLVETGHCFPLEPFTGCKRSHFSRHVESRTMVVAS